MQPRIPKPPRQRRRAWSHRIVPARAKLALRIVRVAHRNIKIPQGTGTHLPATVFVVISTKHIPVNLLGNFHRPLRIDETRNINPRRITGFRIAEGITVQHRFIVSQIFL